MYLAIRYFIVLLSFTIVTKSYAQNSSDLEELETNGFVSVKFGTQMSGIKDEDFVSTNYSPFFNITTGKWLTTYLALQIGYKGFYFNSIADVYKHYYNYIYGETVINVNNVLFPKRVNKKWSMLLHGGGGYFYNNFYGKGNICGNVGLQNNYNLSKRFDINIDISSIIGWDIYQGNLDILQGVTVGVTYFLNIY